MSKVYVNKEILDAQAISNHYSSDETTQEKWMNKRCSNTERIILAFECKKDGQMIGLDLHCNKSWCPECSQIGSISHMRRLSRILPRAMEMGLFDKNKPFGGWSFPVPDILRPFFEKDWIHIKRFKKKVRKIIKRFAGNVRGIEFIHLGGDNKEMNFVPHIHVVTENGQYLKPEILDKIRKILVNYWTKETTYKYVIKNLKEKITETDFHYSYRTEIEKKFHLLRYNSRHTMTWREPVLEKLMYRKSLVSSFGKFYKKYTMSDVIKKFKTDVNSECQENYETEVFESIKEKKCMCCGGELKFLGIMSLEKIYKTRKYYIRSFPIAPGVWLGEKEITKRKEPGEIINVQEE